MREFIKLSRICVPISLDCDLSCKYCYRNAGRIIVPPFNDLMKEFLSQIDPKKTQALVASGGEPLLNWNKVKELFSYAPPTTHKKIMTNGINLTQEIVNYINDNNIEVWVSYDGNISEWTRGIDILNIPEIYSLVCQINHLTFSCVCTARNPNPYICYEEIKKKVNRNFYFHYGAVFADKHLNAELIKNFDYKQFSHGAILCDCLNLDYQNPIPRYFKSAECNVLPNGDIVGMTEIHHKYGTVLNTTDEILAARKKFGDTQYCTDKKCPIFNYCKGIVNSKTEHGCKIQKNKIERKLYFLERNSYV